MDWIQTFELNLNVASRQHARRQPTWRPSHHVVDVQAAPGPTMQHTVRGAVAYSAAAIPRPRFRGRRFARSARERVQCNRGAETWRETLGAGAAIAACFAVTFREIFGRGLQRPARYRRGAHAGSARQQRL